MDKEAATAAVTASSTSNPNPIAKATSMALPNMTDEIKRCDPRLARPGRHSPRKRRHESEYYGTLTAPYAPRNGPIQSIEELLLGAG